MTVTSIIDQIHIIEYDPSYAAAFLVHRYSLRIACPCEQIQARPSGLHGLAHSIQDQITSNLYVFLAVHEKEVVGFCSFAHYRYDERALYVPLLNVRPDYHGYKVGRNLILNARNT